MEFVQISGGGASGCDAIWVARCPPPLSNTQNPQLEKVFPQEIPHEIPRGFREIQEGFKEFPQGLVEILVRIL